MDNHSRFHGLTLRDVVVAVVFVLTFLTAFIANRTHVDDEIRYVKKTLSAVAQDRHALELRVRGVELNAAGSQQKIQHLSEQVALANQKLDRVLERLSGR